MAEERQTLTQYKKNMTGKKIKQGSAVKLTAAGDGEIEPCEADTDVFYGVAISEIRDEESGNIGVIGTYSCLAGDAVTRGARVGPNDEGKFIPATRDGQTVAGVAEESAARADVLFYVTLGVGITLSAPAMMPAKIRKRWKRRS